MDRPLFAIGVTSGILLVATTSAQNINWAEFTIENSRLASTPSLGLGDVEEKDYAFGDFDRDGYIDLISVRKQPHTTQGRRENVLFMNEAGTLVDRSVTYASASDVRGDQGFLTPTNDRDVVVGDVNNDGWLDFVTATTFTVGQPKELSHPRIYINLGESGGIWQGFVYESARIPDWGTYPNMCGLAMGDVTGDGFVDLYFSHYEQMAQVDLNDRLLINDGTGFFTDESSARLPAAMRSSALGPSAEIADLNGDGVNDVIAVSGSGQTGGLTRSSVAYNNPTNEGFFNILQVPYTGAPYHVAVGDLNADGLTDMLLSDDSSDRYLLNQGNDPFGRVTWGPALVFGTDDGFGSNNYITDIDGDGFAEAVICDVDVDLAGCGRRMHIFHNQGTVPGSSVAIREEVSGSDFGALGLPQLSGVHDVAIFDIDNDGDKDMVVGLCNGTQVYMNQRQQPYQKAYASFMSGQLFPGGVQIWDEDIAEYDTATGTWSKYFDGSDVGVREDVRGFHILSNGDLLFAFNQPLDIPGLIGGPAGERVEPHDVVKFVPTSLGSNTMGTWEFYFDGSDIFMMANASAKIDAITEMPDGRLAFSTRGTSQIRNRRFRDEDLIAFEGTLGAATSGIGRKVFDGSRVGLGQVNEDIDAAAIDATGRLLFSVYVESMVPTELSLDLADIGVFTGELTFDTSGAFSRALGRALTGVGSNNLSALHVQ